MGLPRNIEERFKVSSELKSKDAWRFATLAIDSVLEFGIDRYQDMTKKRGIRDVYLCQCLTRWHAKRVVAELDRCAPKDAPDELSKVPARLYVGLNRARQPLYRDVSISRRFLPSLEALNARRMAKDLEELKLREEILAVQGRVYQSRTFPATLKRIIFERDGYCCRACGKHREQLVAERSHLEVDHIKAWVDGGQTSYENGETLCRECNIAKHHSKGYLRKLSGLSPSFNR